MTAALRATLSSWMGAPRAARGRGRGHAPGRRGAGWPARPGTRRPSAAAETQPVIGGSGPALKRRGRDGGRGGGADHRRVQSWPRMADPYPDVEGNRRASAGGGQGVAPGRRRARGAPDPAPPRPPRRSALLAAVRHRLLQPRLLSPRDRPASPLGVLAGRAPHPDLRVPPAGGPERPALPDVWTGPALGPAGEPRLLPDRHLLPVRVRAPRRLAPRGVALRRGLSRSPARPVLLAGGSRRFRCYGG